MPRGGERGTCSLPDCERPHYAKGVCHMHRRRWLKHGSFERGRANLHEPIKNRNGYVLIWAPDHPAAYRPTNRVPEHRLVMEQKLGRYLTSEESVHHINGVRDDNRPENLELWVSKQPAGQRPEDLVAYAREILAQYAAEVDGR